MSGSKNKTFPQYVIIDELERCHKCVLDECFPGYVKSLCVYYFLFTRMTGIPRKNKIMTVCVKGSFRFTEFIFVGCKNSFNARSNLAVDARKKVF